MDVRLLRWQPLEQDAQELAYQSHVALHPYPNERVLSHAGAVYR